jgi:hypothetical protein
MLAHLAEDRRMSAAERRKLSAWAAEVEKQERKRARR